MANVQWQEIPFCLVTPTVSLPFNPQLTGASGPALILDADKCQAGSAKRVTRDNTPQRGGEIMHKHFKTGFVMQIGGYYANVLNASTVPCQMEPACGADLVELDDMLMRALDSIENEDGRLIWTPTGYPNRMVDALRWLGPDGVGGAAFTAVLTEREDQIFTGFQVALVSPYPYASAEAEIDTPLDDGVPVTLDNVGTTDFWPVVEVYGPTSAFTLENVTTGEALVYNAGFPLANPIGSGHFIEFDFFRNTAYFDGSGNTALPGVDVLNSDFWSLAPGDNVIELSGATGLVKWQAAYV
jgi:hypothetical protein